MQAGKTFRIFVSSTFSDMKEERNALQQHVFPRLRELCTQRGCRFQAIDLRWGVRDEAALDQQTMKICLGEIERCQRVTPRPNFIVLLGDRYGWRPLPWEIPAVEFAGIEQRLSNADDRALLDRWYRCDDNAVPAVYCLQPREKEFKEWEEVENRLRSILLQATAGMTLTPDEQLKYTASATEQEIVRGALRVPDAPEHVFCFFRKIMTRNNLPLVEDLPPGESAKDFVDLAKVGGQYQLDGEAHRLLEELKNDKLRPYLRGNIHEYLAEWRADGISTDHIGSLPDALEDCLSLFDDDNAPSNLCVDVWRRLAHVILDEVSKIERVDALDKEIKDHESFGQVRAKCFTGRAGVLQNISDYVKRTDPHPLAVFGDSGSGKTALLAQAMADCESRNADCVIVSRFIGATPNSSDGRALLESLCRQISRRYGADEASIPAEYQKLVEELPQRLALATADKPLIVFLDALDQLSDFEHARNLIWLPRDLPAHARLIVSTLPGECLTQLERKILVANLVKLEPMPKEEGSELLDLWLAEAGRTLQDDQRAEVLGKFAANGLPLYLKLAFEEARRWKSYNLPIQLSADIPGIVRDLFRRLSADHGEMLISRSLGYLAAAKNGLSEDELLDVLSTDKEHFDYFKAHAHHDLPEGTGIEPKLPVVVWSRVYFDLEAYLTERGADRANLLAFYHRQLSEVVAEDYLTGNEKWGRHHTMARYFADQPLVSGNTRLPNIRKMAELPYHQALGALWVDFFEILTNPQFLELKCSQNTRYETLSEHEGQNYFGVYELIEDIRRAFANMPGEEDKSVQASALMRVLRTLEGEVSNLQTYPQVVVQQIFNDLLPSATDPTVGEVRRRFSKYLTEYHGTWVELKAVIGPGQQTWRDRSGILSTPFPCDVQSLTALPGHRLLVFSPDGETYIARVSGQARQVFTPFAPSIGTQRIASRGSVIGLIDVQSWLRFLRVVGYQFELIGNAFPEAKRITQYDEGFVGVFADGTVIKFDGEGNPALTCSSVGMKNADYVAASLDGSYVLLAKKLREPGMEQAFPLLANLNLGQPVYTGNAGALLQMVNIQQRRLIAGCEVDGVLCGVGAALNQSPYIQFQLGINDWLQGWDQPWQDKPRRLINDIIPMTVLSHDTDYLAMVCGDNLDVGVVRYRKTTEGIVVVHSIRRQLKASIRLPGYKGDEILIAFSCLGEEGKLHVARKTERVVESWELSPLSWVKEFERITIKQAMFDSEGGYLAGVNELGERFLWDVNSGYLLGSDWGGQDALLIKWSPDHSYGAICHPGMIEIVNARGEREGIYPVQLPKLVAWDGNSETLVYTCEGDATIRPLLLGQSRFKPPLMRRTQEAREIFKCQDTGYPISLAFSPDGTQIAYSHNFIKACPTPSAGQAFPFPVGNPLHTELIIVNRATQVSRKLIGESPRFIGKVHFLSNTLLAATDAEGAVLVLDVDSGKIVARWWAWGSIVAMLKRSGDLLLADDGVRATQGPLVYQVVFHERLQGG